MALREDTLLLELQKSGSLHPWTNNNNNNNNNNKNIVDKQVFISDLS